MYKEKIKNLEAMHQSLNTQIDDMERNRPHTEVNKLAEMKKKRLAVKDEIFRLNKLQWEHDHERVDLGD
jgi:uncharacterized protein YdcH (DUF465 family)